MIIYHGSYNGVLGRAPVLGWSGRPSVRKPYLGALSDEEAWFETARAQIASQYAGQFVVVKDRAVRGAYPDYASAFTAASSMFPQGGFLIKQALPQEPIRKV